MPTKEQIADILGRPLTPKEDTGFDVYIQIAKEQLGSLLGYSLDLSEGASTQVFTLDADSKSLMVPPFTNVTSVKIGGKEVEYTTGTTNKPFLVEIILGEYRSSPVSVEVTAEWGYSEYPAGILLLLANMFLVVANGQTTGGGAKVKSEESLSHKVTYETTSSQFESFAKDNANIIDLYRLPYASLVSAGRILWSNDSDISEYRPYY